MRPKRVILLIESSRAFGQLLVKGVIRYTKNHTPWIFYRETSVLTEQSTQAVNWQADGIIAHVKDAQVAQKLIAPGIPAVVKGINSLIPNVCNIVGDTKAIAEMAARHLMNLGLKSYAFCGFNKVLWSKEFAEYFSKTLEEKGFPVSVYMQSKARIKRAYQAELEHIAEWLRTLPKPVGIMASNDDRGQHVIEACKLANLRIPNDVGVIGVDNDEWICNLTSPPMSSIALSTEQAGYEAAELLDRLMAGEKVQGQTIVIKPTVIVARQSTDLYCVDDPEVLSALQFIKKNHHLPIQTEDIVNATTICRRALYYRFKRSLGVSINQELRRMRIEHIANMLIETDLPVSQIIADCGYTSFRNAARYFKKEKGMGPLQYRHKYGRKL